MTHLVVEISKYLMILLMLGYVVLTLLYFRRKTHEGRSFLSGCQRFFLFWFHFLGFLVLFIQLKDFRIPAFYGLQVIFFIAYLSLWAKIYPTASRMLLNNSCMLLAFGFIIQTRLNLDKSLRQFVIVAVAGMASLLVPWIIKSFRKLEKGGIVCALLGLALLGAILAGGQTEYGAKLSFSVGSFSLQPSEFVKLTFVFFIASFLREDNSLRQVFFTTILAAAHVLCLVLSRDLGTALVFFLTYIAMLFVGTGRFLYPAAGLAAGAGASVLAYQVFSHVRTRVEVWKDPFADATGDGWQILQSLFAIGSGGWFGLGLAQGKAPTIPVVTKDFVFSAIAEEMGGVVALCLVLVCLQNLLQIFWVSTWMYGRFQKLVVSGLAVVYGSQVFINVGGVTKMIPSTGITFPFISYGGSSILATFLLFAIIQGYKIQLEEEEAERFEEEYGYMEYGYSNEGEPYDDYDEEYPDDRYDEYGREYQDNRYDEYGRRYQDGRYDDYDREYQDDRYGDYDRDYPDDDYDDYGHGYLAGFMAGYSQKEKEKGKEDDGRRGRRRR